MHFLASPCSLDKFHSFNLSMNQLSFCFQFLFLMFFSVKAQTPSNQFDLATQDAVTNFQPSLAVVIGILSIMFSFTFVLILYAKFCHRSASGAAHNQQHIQDGLLRSRSRSSGIDKTVIESLPFFRFSLLKGSREGLECAICLSKFEDIEILRLLPKCKHAFHINCLDQWLEKHSSCPLCRNKISADDLSTFTYSNSLRFLWNQSELREESNVELYIQREESHRESSRFSIASSFRKNDKGKKEEELPIQVQQSDETNEDEKVLHKFNHKIIVSDVVLKNRWSNVNSSDLIFLNSEMLHQISSSRFCALESNNEPSMPTRVSGDSEIMNIKEEMDRKREFESKLSKIEKIESFPPLPDLPNALETKGSSENPSKVLSPSDTRSMSEIIVHSRFQDFNTRTSDNREPSQPENSVKEERMRRLWLPIARRTVQWFANRERRSSSDQPHNATRLSNV